MRADTRKILAVATGSASQIALSAAGALLTTLLLPPSDRGRYVLLVTVLAVSAPLAGLGSNVGLRRDRPTHANPGALESAYFRLTLTSSLVHGLLAPLIIWAVTSQQIPQGTAEAAAVFVLGVTQVLAWQFVELWYARQHFRTGATYAAFNALAALLAAGWAAISPSFVQVLWAQAATTALLQVAQGIHVHRTRVAEVTPRAPLKPLASSMIRVGAPSLVMTAGMSLTFRLDRLILGAIWGPQSVAVYALAGSFAEIPRFIPAAFGQIANGHAAQTRTRLPLRPYLLPSAWLTCLGAAGAGGVGIAVMMNINSVYRDSIAPLLVLLLAEIALIPYSIVIRMILGGGRVKLSAGVGVVAITLSAAIYWQSVAEFSVMGAAWASLVVYAGVSVASLLVHRRQEEA